MTVWSGSILMILSLSLFWSEGELAHPVTPNRAVRQLTKTVFRVMERTFKISFTVVFCCNMLNLCLIFHQMGRNCLVLSPFVRDKWKNCLYSCIPPVNSAKQPHLVGTPGGRRNLLTFKGRLLCQILMH
jgi:hypothetical protein